MNTGEQNLIGKPSQVIRFNKLTGQLEKPTILLKTRGGKTLGELQYTDLDLSFVAKGLDNLSFEVHKIVDGKECKYWDRLTDLCIIEYVGYGQFECHPTINDIDETIKTCVCESLETELGQHTIRDIHINDEDAILYGRKVGDNNLDFDSSGTFIPTVLYDKNDEVHSLLNRVLKEKTPHWTVGYVSSKFAVNGYVYDADQIQRTFTIEGITPYDFFDSDASKEFGCVFTYDTYNRKVNCYNLEDCVYDTSTNEIIEGYYYLDGKYYDENNNEIIGISNLGHCSGIGEDTTIFISKSKLANSFSLDSSKDSIKNCFYVSGGDDTITNIVAAANVTGNNYIYLFGNFQYEDMSEELVQKITEYSSMLEEMEESFNKVGGVYVHNDIDYTYDTTKKAVVDKNNRIIVTSKYIDEKIYVLDTLAYYENEKCYDREGIELSSTEAIYDKAGLYTEYTNLIDRINYWEHTRFPKVEPVDTTAERQKEILIKHFETDLNPVYIQNGCSSDSFAHVTSNIESVIGVVCDERYTIKILKDDSHTITCDTIDKENTIGYWNGTISLTRTTNEKDSVEFELDVKVVLAYDTEDCIGFCKQKIDIAIAKMDIKELDFTKLSNEQLKDLISQYNLNSVKSFMEGFDSCRSILNDLYANMELEENQIPLSEAMILSTERYTERYEISKSIYEDLTEKIEKMNSEKDILNSQIIAFRESLDMETCFGEELWKEFRSYVREDEYNNGNYISDGLSNCEILEKAKELLDVAKKELSKACVIQKTISGDINNIFSLEEKESLHDKFALFNYVRVCADDNIYKLRLMGISFSEDSPEKLNVTFSEQIEDVSGKKSDVQKILEQSQSIATTYSSTTKQAKQGASAMSNFNTLKQEGLNSSLYLIKNSNTEEVTFGNTGLSCKSMLDNGIYSPYEVRVTHNGIYMSENNFNSVKTALGRFKYNGEWVYGLCTDVLFGDLIIGEKMLISNKNGSVSITGDGITLDGGKITWEKKLPSSSVEGLDDTVQDFVNVIGDLQSQIDGEITSWFEEYEPSIANEPASTWITDVDKIKHEGDLFYNTATGAAYRYIYNSSTKEHEWSIITDTAITEALEKASKAQDTADKKRRVFVVTPTPPYDIGDLWSQGSDGDIMKCKTAKSEGQTYSASDWEKASKYTDDTAWKAWTSDSGEFGEYKEDIKNQIDGKSNCTYGGSTPPSNPETGDLWFCTDGSGSYDSNKAYMYNGSTWKESNGVPDDVWDIADGKSSIFVVKPENPLSDVDSHCYYKGDIWILESDMTLNGKLYKKGSIMTSTSDSTSFDDTHWVEKVRYTDDTTAKEANEKITNFQSNVNKLLNSDLPLNEMGDDYIFSPYIGGGYLYIAGDDGSVEINPTQEKTDYTGYSGNIFNIRNSKKESVLYADTNGDVTLKGTIYANGGKIGGDNGWTISNNAIWNGTDSSTSIETGIYIGTDAIRQYNATNDKYFHVEDGKLTCNDIDISGSISSSTISGSKIISTCDSGYSQIYGGYITVGNNNTEYGRFDYGTFENLNGIGLINRIPTGGYVALGHTENNTDGTLSSIIDYYIDSSTSTIKHYFNGNSYINGDSYLNGLIYVNGNSYLNGLKDGGIYCSGQFSTEGKICIGNTSYGNYMLNVKGSAYISTNLDVSRTINASNSWTINSTRIQTLNTPMGSGGTEGIFLVCGEENKDYIHVQDDDDTMFRVSYTGAVYSADGKLSTSDRNKKHNINVISDIYENLFYDLKPITYVFNGRNRTHIGYIAQDVEDSLINNNIDTNDFAGYWREQKWCETKDGNIEYLYDNNGEPLYDYGLRYEEFIALNTHMIQKAYEKIESQQQQINTLQNTLDSVLEELQQLKQNN